MIALSSHNTICIHCLFAHRMTSVTAVCVPWQNHFWIGNREIYKIKRQIGGPMQKMVRSIHTFRQLLPNAMGSAPTNIDKLSKTMRWVHRRVVHAHGPIVYVIVYMNFLLWKPGHVAAGKIYLNAEFLSRRQTPLVKLLSRLFRNKKKY